MGSFALRGATPRLIELKPSASAVVKEVTEKGTGKANIREARALPCGLAFLLQSQSGFSIVLTDFNGVTARVIALEPYTDADGLVVTDVGVATVVTLAGGIRVLREYDLTGSKISEIRLPCYTGNGLLSMGARPATVCTDGMISQHGKDNTVTSIPSWVRAGTLTEVLPDDKLVIVDQTTLQILVDDLRNRRISSPNVNVPDFEAAIGKFNLAASHAQSRLPAGSPPLGKPLLAMATTSNSSSWYVLVYPYDRIGPTVVRIDQNVSLNGRYKCVLPRQNMSSIHRIVAKDGELILVSPAGDLVRYRL
jgi:hypothetical protein